MLDEVPGDAARASDAFHSPLQDVGALRLRVDGETEVAHIAGHLRQWFPLFASCFRDRN